MIKINKNNRSNGIYVYINSKIYSIIFIFFIILLSWQNNNYHKLNSYQQDDLTLVSAYYKVKSRHTYNEYLNWINNIVKLNKSIVFFTNKELMGILKESRPKELYYKTVFIEMEIEDFYSHKKFFKEFNETYLIDIEYITYSYKCNYMDCKNVFILKIIYNHIFYYSYKRIR